MVTRMQVHRGNGEACDGASWMESRDKSILSCSATAGHPVITAMNVWTGLSAGTCHRAGYFGPDPLADDDNRFRGGRVNSNRRVRNAGLGLERIAGAFNKARALRQYNRCGSHRVGCRIDAVRRVAL